MYSKQNLKMRDVDHGRPDFVYVDALMMAMRSCFRPTIKTLRQSFWLSDETISSTAIWLFGWSIRWCVYIYNYNDWLLLTPSVCDGVIDTRISRRGCSICICSAGHFAGKTRCPTEITGNTTIYEEARTFWGSVYVLFVFTEHANETISAECIRQLFDLDKTDRVDISGQCELCEQKINCTGRRWVRGALFNILFIHFVTILNNY